MCPTCGQVFDQLLAFNMHKVVDHPGLVQKSMVTRRKRRLVMGHPTKKRRVKEIPADISPDLRPGCKENWATIGTHHVMGQEDRIDSTTGQSLSLFLLVSFFLFILLVFSLFCSFLFAQFFLCLFFIAHFSAWCQVIPSCWKSGCGRRFLSNIPPSSKST